MRWTRPCAARSSKQQRTNRRATKGKAIPHTQSGFFVDGDAKGLARFQHSEGRTAYVATQNDDSTQVFISSNEPSARTISPNPLDAYAVVTFSDGTIERRELYYGSGYLSQSSRHLRLSSTVESVTLYGYDGASRTISE